MANIIIMSRGIICKYVHMCHIAVPEVYTK